ncbi:unnamed protein product [Cuscuta campestris]|uniref:Uncharacterized protein n=1 Tax=Cuscuta campestris TaxID=132261 RepID=A0A484NQW0_9ASTE|nr:unnamed protein product [Cuscuta campestris]
MGLEVVSSMTSSEILVFQCQFISARLFFCHVSLFLTKTKALSLERGGCETFLFADHHSWDKLHCLGFTMDPFSTKLCLVGLILKYGANGKEPNGF